MASIIILFILFALCLFGIKISLKRKNVFKFIAVGIFNLLIIETLVYALLLGQIIQANCFFLIGHQNFLDILIKARLTYATYFAQGKESFIFRLDPDLGYSIGADKDTGLYQSNAQGFRADRNYTLEPGDNVLRVAAFGDSFVFCDDEKNADTWEHILEQSAGNLEVLNFGVSGYGLGQSYLRYLKDGLKFQPDIVFFNYIETGSRDVLDPKLIVSDINLRNSYIYRALFQVEDGVLKSRSVSPFDLFNPAFRKKYLFEPLGLSGEEFLLSRNIFSHFNLGLFLKQNLAKRRYNNELMAVTEKEEELETVNLEILRNLLQSVVRNQTKIIFFCPKPLLELSNGIQGLLTRHKSHVIYVQSGMALEEQFNLDNARGEELKNFSNHYNALGNKYYARAVLKVIKSRPWAARNKVFSFDEQSQSFVGVE